jgi:hypothetical protein
MNKKNLKERAEILSQLIIVASTIYKKDNLSEGQRGLLETIIGAGIWYLPSSVDLYSGFISIAALESLENDPHNTKLVEEHSFPRKLAAEMLFKSEIVEKLKTENEHLEELYQNKFGRFNLVLKTENDKLKKFQKKGVFVNENEAYKLAGIELTAFSKERYQEFKRNKSTHRRKTN